MKRCFSSLCLFAGLLLLLLPACERKDPLLPDPSGDWNVTKEFTTVEPKPKAWDGVKRGRITYQLLIYAFACQNGDGMGDLPGLTHKLDYLDSLGVSALWLSPIHPAMSYHGYDVTDYAAINPQYGTMEDFATLVAAARQHQIRIYLDYVINHSGRNHAWFKEASQGPENPYRDFYIFSENPKEDIAAGAIPMIATEGAKGYDAGQWFSVPATPQNPTPGALKFHSHFWTNWFADLNYGAVATASQSAAFKAITSIAKDWIDAGVDGFRLDAVKHIYHNEHSNENPLFLEQFYNELNAHYRTNHSQDLYMVGEVFSEAQDVAPYYKGLPAYFEFSFWWRVKDAINNGKGYYLAKDLLGYQDLYRQYRSNPIVATKLSNHDENRAGSDFGKLAAKEKLAGAVLLTAPGEPYIYYGEELGYFGTKDRGDIFVRQPLYWGDSYTTNYTNDIDPTLRQSIPNVAQQTANPNSVWHVYHQFARLRNTYPSLAEGIMVPHPVYNETASGPHTAIAAWYRVAGEEKVLVLHNMGAMAVTLSLDDPLCRTLACQGDISIKQAKKSDPYQVRMEGYSSVVFEVETK